MITTGLIIAAGAGTRLSDKTSIPKPLRKVCGVPLLSRCILSAAKAGLKKIYIVVGFQKERIISYARSQKWPVDIRFIENPEWKKSNGLSVLAAKDHVKENFALMMSDHVFDDHIVKRLVSFDPGENDAILAVDEKIHQIFDRDDATKVEVRDGRIKDIGKNLVQYNAIDTGLFLLTPAVFKALEAVRKSGDCSLSDGIHELARLQKAGIFNIGDYFWQDVDTKESLKHAEKLLFNACRKKTDGFVSRHFNRYISLFISSWLIKTPVSANAVTVSVTLVGLLSGYFASLGTYQGFLTGAVLFKLTSILDGVDGEISKLRMTASRFGQWMDTASDNLTYLVFFTGMVLGLARSGYAHAHLLGVSALLGVVLLIFCLFFYLIKFSDSGSFLAVQKEFRAKKDLNLFGRIFVKLYFVIKRDFFSAFFLVLAILGKPQWIVFFVALAANIAWVVIVWNKFLPAVKPSRWS